MHLFFSCLFSLSCRYSLILLFRKASCCSSACEDCIVYVLMIKQEIAEREYGLERVHGAKWAFYISGVWLSKIFRPCMCLTDASF